MSEVSGTSRRGMMLFVAASLAAPLAARSANPLNAADEALVERARAYLMGLSSALGRFSQTDPRGHVTTGTFYLNRPGRARFEYDPPSGLVVASNGFRVAVLDRRLGTLTAYPLGATPLGVLLSRDIRIDKDVAIGAVRRTPTGFAIVAHRASKRGEGEISIDFTDKPLALTGWSIRDPQGGVTQVRLIDFAPSKRLPNAFFELAPNTPAPAAPRA